MMQTRSTFSSRLERAFENFPSRIAVHTRNASIAYDQLEQWSNIVAHQLSAAGVGEGDRVALFLKRSPALICAQIAALRLGATYSPIDTTSPQALRSAALNALNAKVVLVDNSCDVPNNFHGAIMQLRTSAETEAEMTRSPRSVWARSSDDSVAYIMFTSGTTGVPKGVMIRHSGISRLVCAPNYASFTSNERFAFMSSPAFDASTLEVWAPLLNGGCCVIQERHSPTLDELADFLLEQQITSTWLTSGLFSALAQHRPDSFQNLRQLLAGGERVSPSDARRIVERYPLLRFIHAYGPTENTTFTTGKTITSLDTRSAGGLPLGSAISGTSLRIGLDDVDATRGELLAGGEGVALGYLNDEALTASKFLHIDGKRWYRTGDIVRRRPDGELEFEGRIDRQVKLQGHRVELDAVESTLGQYPEIRQAAVVVAGDSTTSRHLVAFFTATASADSRDIRSFLGSRLAPHSVPHVLLQLDEMPFTSTGKIDFGRLDALASARTSAPSELGIPFTTDTEKRLAQLWTELFTDANIHAQSSFESVGGTSLLALQLSAAVRRTLRKDFAPIDVLKTPTLREQAALIDRLRVLDWKESQPLTESQLTLTRGQKSVLAADQLDESHCALLVHTALYLPETIDLDRIRSAFTRLAERHPMLRISISELHGEPVASVAASLKSGWWSEFDAGEVLSFDEELPPDVLRIINRPLDVTADGVMRVDVWRSSDASTLVVWTTHHVAIDESSIDLCLLELDALIENRALPPAQGSANALALMEQQQTDARALTYWPRRIVSSLEDSAPALPRALSKGCEITANIQPTLSTHVLAQARAWKMTPFVPILASYARAIQQSFGTQYGLVATPFSRRSVPAARDIVGYLLDMNLVEAGQLQDETPAEHVTRLLDITSNLQHLSFFPFDEIASTIGRTSPGTERHLSNFAFTWREAPTRPITLGGWRGKLLRVPQQGARFGMTLHAWMQDGALRCSIETLDNAITKQKAEEVGAHFLRNLEELSSIEIVLRANTAHRSRPSDHSDLLRSGLVSVVRQFWASNTAVEPKSLNEESNFWDQGGTSLSALQMISQLSQTFNAHVEPSSFFADPTLRNLERLVAVAKMLSDKLLAFVGSPEASRLIVLFPGNCGPALGMHVLASNLQRQLGSGFGVAIIDFQEMLGNAPESQVLEFIRQQSNSILDALGRDRLAGLVGFSSGGVIAMTVADSVRSHSPLEVWLLDTYRPFGRVNRIMRELTRRPIRAMLVRSPLLARVLGTHLRKPLPKTDELLNARAIRSRNRARHELSELSIPEPTGRRHLIQAIQTSREQILFRNRRSNGFDERMFEAGSITRVDGHHEELITRLAEQTATVIASSLVAERSRSTSPVATAQSAPPSAR